jgi:hypothetical protein
MTNPSNEQVLAALDRTGFILEYRTAQTLRSKNFETYISEAYPDPASGLSREIDVRATWERAIGRQPVDLILMIDLIIECKSGLNPFILIGERNQNPVFVDDAINLSFDPYSLAFKEKRYNRVRYDLRLESLPGTWRKEDFVGYQLVRMHQQSGNWRADNNAVYDSILYPLAKAWQHWVKEMKREEQSDPPEWQYPAVSYVIPIIVTAAPVFTVDVTEESPVVMEVGWANLKREFKSDELSGDLRIDVVNSGHFTEYLDSRILKIANNAADALKANIHLFDPEWLLANLGKPANSDFFNAWLNYVRTKRNSKEAK